MPAEGRTHVGLRNVVLDDPARKEGQSILCGFPLESNSYECKDGRSYVSGCAATMRPFAKVLWTLVFLAAAFVRRNGVPEDGAMQKASIQCACMAIELCNGCRWATDNMRTATGGN